MGKIQLARIDDRLIHGQVMTKWSKGLGTNALYIVDDEVAKDDFMKTIYVNTNSSSGVKIKVFSEQEVVDAWNEDQFGKDQAILLYKSLKSVLSTIEKGLPVTDVNVGGMSKKPDSRFIISSVAVTKEDEQTLKDIAAHNINVYFQTVPDTKKISLNDAIK